MYESSYRSLVAWQRAMEMVTAVYQATDAFPTKEVYGLTSQLRRAAVSVPSNIAEGKGRRSQKEYVQFLCRARGSLFEVETQLEIASNLGYFDEAAATAMRDHVGGVARKLNALIAAIEKQIHGADTRHPTPDTSE